MRLFMKQAGTVTAREWGVPGKADDALRWPEAFPQETHGRPMSERARDRQGLRWRVQWWQRPRSRGLVAHERRQQHGIPTSRCAGRPVSREIVTVGNMQPDDVTAAPPEVVAEVLRDPAGFLAAATEAAPGWSVRYGGPEGVAS